MQSLSIVVLSLSLAAVLHKSAEAMNWDYNLNEGLSVTEMLTDIDKERSFDTLLVVHQLKQDETILEAIYEFPVPKVFVTSDHNFEFIRIFNAEILALIIMSHDLDLELLETAAQTLNYMRQTRIVVIAWNMLEEVDHVKAELLKICQKYKMTNVLLKFVPNEVNVSSPQYDTLKPYPEYHWDMGMLDQYYPQHWWNMRNTTLITFTAEHMMRSFLYVDAEGNLRRNGFVARLILLFAERFNVNLQMYQSLDDTDDIGYTAVNQMVEDNLVDLPMTLSSGNDGKWLYRSYAYEVYERYIMVPCAQTLTIREVYSILLNEYFFGCIIICALLLSIMHSLVDYVFGTTTFIFTDRVLPGVLGQSFVAINSSWLGHKFVYLLVFFVGLNISTQFGANINTLFTSPPYHQQIETFDDLNRSPLKVVVLNMVYEEDQSMFVPLAPSLSLTDNGTFFEESRNSFNTSTAYDVASSSWEFLKRKQQYFSHKSFCIPDNLTLIRTWPRAIQLQQHSELKEPLDYLIHRVEELGLKEVWYTSVFSDMLRAKKISIRDPNPDKGAKALSVNDLFWIWMILLIGLSFSLAVFIVEMRFMRSRENVLEL